MDYAAAMDYLASLGKFGSQLGLARIEKLLELMGNPERKYKTIHVTGTNGKGSTAAMITAVLTAANIPTGLYTSPHLEEYTERMKVNGREISRGDFAAVLEYTAGFVQKMIHSGLEHPTEFEILTAAAFEFFARRHVEYAVIEVGLGGLLDSTNVIIPEVSVITNVSLEHMDRCGDTVEKIAVHKAGIIKAGRPVITAAEGGALQVIEAQAKKLSSPLWRFSRDFSVEVQRKELAGQTLHFTCQRTNTDLTVKLPLLGEHQTLNGAVAIAACLCLASKEKRLQPETICQGISQTRWPGRFEVVPGAPTLIFDGAHNPAGIKVLKQTLDDYFSDQRPVFVLGILRDKAIVTMVKTLLTSSDKVVVTTPLSDRASEAAETARIIQESVCLPDRQIQVIDSIEAAIAAAKKWAGADGVVCISGSLYLIGQARACCNQ